MYTKYTFFFLILLPTVYISSADSKKLSKKELEKKKHTNKAYKKTLQKAINWCDKQVDLPSLEGKEEPITKNLKEEFLSTLKSIDKNNSDKIELKSNSDKYTKKDLLKQNQHTWIKDLLERTEYIIFCAIGEAYIEAPERVLKTSISYYPIIKRLSFSDPIKEASLNLYNDGSGKARIKGNKQCFVDIICTQWNDETPNGFVNIRHVVKKAEENNLIAHQGLSLKGQVKNGVLHGIIHISFNYSHYRKQAPETASIPLSTYEYHMTTIWSHGKKIGVINDETLEYLSYKDKRTLQNLSSLSW